MADNTFNIHASNTAKDYPIGLPLESSGGISGQFTIKKKQLKLVM